MKSDREWRHWGAKDPLWAVASWQGKRRMDKSPWTREEFLALGASDLEDVAAHWRHYGLLPERCVEIGCGAGRMTAALRDVFESVIGVDISHDQLRIAGQHVGDRDSRVLLCLVETGTLPIADQSCTGMFSCLVFQHFSDYRAIESYLRETYRLLVPGGTVCFHIPVLGAHRIPPKGAVRLRLQNLRARIARLVGSLDIMEFHRYPPDRIFATLGSIGFDRLEMRIFNMRSNQDAHSFFFAQKPGAERRRL